MPQRNCLLLLCWLVWLTGTDANHCDQPSEQYDETSCVIMGPVTGNEHLRRLHVQNICEKLSVGSLRWFLPSMSTTAKQNRIKSIVVRDYFKLCNQSCVFWLGLRRLLPPLDKYRYTDASYWQNLSYWRWDIDNKSLDAMSYTMSNVIWYDNNPDNLAYKQHTLDGLEICVTARVWNDNGITRVKWFDQACAYEVAQMKALGWANSIVNLIVCEALVDTRLAIYKQWWFYVLIISLVTVVVGSIALGSYTRKRRRSRRGRTTYNTTTTDDTRGDTLDSGSISNGRSVVTPNTATMTNTTTTNTMMQSTAMQDTFTSQMIPAPRPYLQKSIIRSPNVKKTPALLLTTPARLDASESHHYSNVEFPKAPVKPYPSPRDKSTAGVNAKSSIGVNQAAVANLKSNFGAALKSTFDAKRKSTIGANLKSTIGPISKTIIGPVAKAKTGAPSSPAPSKSAARQSPKPTARSPSKSIAKSPQKSIAKPPPKPVAKVPQTIVSVKAPLNASRPRSPAPSPLPSRR